MSNNLLPQLFPLSTQASMQQMGPSINVPTPEVKLSQPNCNYQEEPSLPLRTQITGRQDFRVMLPSGAGIETGSMLTNMDTTQLHAKRKSPLQPRLLSVQNKRMVAIEHRTLASELNKVPMPSSVSPKTQYLPASLCKNTFVSCNKPGKQTAARKQSSQKILPLKPQNESFESVRFKMRESLAGALAMVQCQMEAPKESNKETATSPLEGHISEPVSAASGVNVQVANGSTAILTLSDPCPVGGISVQSVLPEILTITKTSDAREIISLEPQAIKPFAQDDVSYSDNVLSKDDLLQGNELSWALETDIEFAENFQNEMNGAMANDVRQPKEKFLLDPQVLAFKIEAELFKLFGGVNKKYKEKGRSLLFNLKDKNNPKLREKVMYGEIPAARLCSMSAEELASKELAEWRQAKAEEMAQMVVLQDSQVDIRSLVRKTHKGEFKVEVEPMDSGSVEVSVGFSSLNWSRPKNIKKETHSVAKTCGIKNEYNGSNEGTGLINGVAIDDEMQAATGSLPPIVSLDEFISSLDSESPSESSLSSDTEKRAPVPENNGAEAVLVCSSPKQSANIDLGASPVRAEDNDRLSSKPYPDLKSEIASATLREGERVWEGAIQMSPSSVSSVIGILRSGEKATTKEWPTLLEIKGRVRLDAFEKFVRELPNSRSRAVMIMCFVCTKECSKKDQENISEVVDSYAKDERVGFAEPASGVELYLCPTRGKTGEILNKIVPKNQIEFLKSLDDDGLIGVVVWRRPQFKKPPLSNSNHLEKPCSLNTSRYGNMMPQVNHDDGGDVPPGFGPMAMTRDYDDDDDDDLPEFNYCSGGDVVMNCRRRSESVRELIHKYGKSEPLWNQNFNGEDNEILPEWQPQQPNTSLVNNHINGGSMVRPQCSEWWPRQARRGGY